MIGLCAFGLAGCQMTAASCDGWRQIAKPINPAALVKTERRLAEDIAAHNEFGVKQGCWQ